MLTKQHQRKIEMRSWPQFTVPFAKKDGTKVSSRQIRDWCKRSLQGDFRIEAIKRDSLLSDKQVAIGALVRIEQVEDQVLFRLRWHDFR